MEGSPAEGYRPVVGGSPVEGGKLFGHPVDGKLGAEGGAGEGGSPPVGEGSLAEGGRLADSLGVELYRA